MYARPTPTSHVDGRPLRSPNMENTANDHLLSPPISSIRSFARNSHNKKASQQRDAATTAPPRYPLQSFYGGRRREVIHGGPPSAPPPLLVPPPFNYCSLLPLLPFLL
ncbi:hypothetical protein BHE74_00047366 [Ensete ventricosum]|nr:hypothetical protein BHE74_00047366 [Ensete ventricosum]